MGIAIVLTFILGYVAIALEHPLKVDKAATALLTGVICWTIYIMNQADAHPVVAQLMEHLGEIAGILFFLLGAMTIVELVDAHDGFQVISAWIVTKNKVQLLWVIGLITFFLSAILDNLTTTIVIITLLRKLITAREDKLFFAGITVIAANAGGAWSPIGDVTTTMLWIGNQITTANIMLKLFVPSFLSLAVPLIFVSFRMKGNIETPEKDQTKVTTSDFERKLVFALGIGALIFVPVFKTITHLPPFMGILLGLGVMWVVTEFIHGEKNDEDKHPLSVVHALRKIDTPSILFFLGILVSISALEATGQLRQIADWLTQTVANDTIVVMSIGLLSAVVDNVPLVAAAQGMYTLDQFPTDHYFWEFLAYAAGTGGSILIIGSAAGVAAMGMEKIEFFWYLRRISWLALLGYFVGAFAYILEVRILG
jgi:Na+/H+ antiporter NhaD/arsenite permease-like protein